MLMIMIRVCNDTNEGVEMDRDEGVCMHEGRMRISNMKLIQVAGVTVYISMPVRDVLKRNRYRGELGLWAGRLRGSVIIRP